MVRPFMNRTGKGIIVRTAGILLLVFLLIALLRDGYGREVDFLSAEETAWLADHPVIRLAPDPDYAPIEYFDESGKYCGLAADYIALVEEMLGIRFQIVRLNNWDEILKKTKDGEIDMWGAAAQNPQRSKYMWFTGSYVAFPSVIITRESVTESLTPEKLSGMKVAIATGYADHDFIKFHFPHLLLDEVPTIETGLRKVSFGMVDAFITNLGAATYYIEKGGITNLRVAGDVDYIFHLGFAVRKDWPELRAILQKALGRIDPIQRTVLSHKWVRLERDAPLLNRELLLGIVAGMGVLALVSLGLLAWNRSLQSLVDRRTQELKKELTAHKQARKALKTAHQELELRVEERTAELIGANTALQAEICQRKQAEEALKESEERYRILFNSSNDAMVVYEMSAEGPGSFVEVNDMACRMSGYSREELLDGNGTELIGFPETLEKWTSAMERLRKEGRSVHEDRITMRDGRRVPLEVISSRFDLDGRSMILSCARDISERKKAESEKERLEAQLHHAEKMEAIGTLAGGIAHDFNNILAAIIGYTEIMLSDAPAFGDTRNSLDMVLKAALRARDLIRQILAFSRMKSTGARVPVDVGAIFKETAAFLRATLPKSIEIRPNIGLETGSALADPAQIQQVLLNLCTNAAHAMEEHGGVLDLSLDRTEILTETTIAHNTLKPGPYVVLTVRDTGHGMSTETLERIFDPYFTTKEVGKGSGLGLAVVQGIVDRYEGAVDVQSEPGRGATFKVYLPRTSDVPVTMDTKTGSLPHGTERILCIDDEEDVSAVTGRMLEMLSYRVERKTDCLKALNEFRAAPDRFDLIITDYAMPHMNGIDFAGEIMKSRPRMPMILCTGYGDRIDKEKTRSVGIRALAVKPLNLRELAELVRNALDENRVSSLYPAAANEKSLFSGESGYMRVG